MLTTTQHQETTITTTRVLSHGGGRYTTTSVHAAPQDLPKGTYGIAFNPMTGYSLTALEDLSAPTYRVYGRRDETVTKVLRTYAALDRSLGVLFEGDKGIGKSSTTVELARQARDRFNLPVIFVNHDTPGIADFLSELGECVIVFDEFEKNFPKNSEGNSQEQFLSLFDGIDATKRLYIVTVNDTFKLSPFFLNRPGRFHYLISFDYPDPDEVHEYITNEAPEASPEQVADIVAFAFGARLNYDHLRAIATELNIAGSGVPVSELVADLNIRDTEDRDYDITAHLRNGEKLELLAQTVELFSGDEEELHFETSVFNGISEYAYLYVGYDPAKAVMQRRTKTLVVDGSGIVETRLRVRSSEALDGLAEWERELLMAAGDERPRSVAIDEVAEGTLAGYQVERLEFAPSVSSRGRFFSF